MYNLVPTTGLVAFLVSVPLAVPAADLAASGEKVVRLYAGPAPGSESWTQTEQENRSNTWQTRVVFNVKDPTLTVFPADPARASGTAVIICPGGAFFALSIDSEGFEVARALNAKGVTCFVLKYRLVECKTDDPTRELMTRGNLEPLVAPIVKLAMADGLAAIGHVRRHAAEYGVKPDRIGIMGFSAGGTVAASVAFNYTAETRPNFAAPIYLAYTWTLKTNGVPPDAPPPVPPGGHGRPTRPGRAQRGFVSRLDGGPKAGGVAPVCQRWPRLRDEETRPAHGPLDRTLCGLAGNAGAFEALKPPGSVQPNSTSGTSWTAGGTVKNSAGGKLNSPATRLLGKVSRLLR